MTTQDDMVPKSTGCKKGDSGADVRRLQAYLARFGYLDSPLLDEFGLSHAEAEPAPEKEGTFDEHTERALVNLQERYGVKPTGTLTKATLDLINQPRCGFPDAPAAASALTPLEGWGDAWPTTNLRWGLGTSTNDLPLAQVRASMAMGLSWWAAVTPLTFTETTYASNPEIRIYFGGLNHPPCTSAFGATTLAHAFHPPPPNNDITGDAHFNDNYTWSFALPATDWDLPTVAGHEFGHSLGLTHSEVNGALMWPYMSGAQRFLHQDDITRIQAIYGQQQTVTRTIAQLYATPHTRNAWVLPTGMSWLRISPTTNDGVTNTFAAFASARRSAATATFQITDGQITAVYR